MRPWLAVLFLLLLPFQFTWAGAETHCQQTAGAAESHFGHHAHDCQLDGGAAGDDARLHADCGFCQIALSAALLESGTRPPSHPGHVLVATPQTIPASAPSSEPERPKWRFTA
mgnify:FL=1